MPSGPEYMRDYMRNRARRMRADIITHLGGKCVKCGSLDRLQVDHIDPTTKTSHRITMWSRVKRDAELAKCQLLCHGCHWAKTIRERRDRAEQRRRVLFPAPVPRKKALR